MEHSGERLWGRERNLKEWRSILKKDVVSAESHIP